MLEQRVRQVWPPERWSPVTVVVAVSGGADSTALLRALTRLRDTGPGRLVVAHYNHGWRGAESAADAEFVVELAAALGWESCLGVADSSEAKNEAAARRARYRFLREVAGRTGARYVATAHTRDDQIETILQRLLRGTGLRGLSGIRSFRPLTGHTSLVRPLLETTRDELRGYLRELEQTWREDSSNRDPRYLRNRVRHEILPWLRERATGNLDQTLTRVAALAGEHVELVECCVEPLLADVISRRTSELVELHVQPLKRLPPVLLRELLRCIWAEQNWPLGDMDYETWHELARIAVTDSAARHFPGGIEVRSDGETTSFKFVKAATPSSS